jgi:putative hydrolases of HD superfamily
MNNNNDFPMPFGGHELIGFLLKADALKSVYRTNSLIDGTRKENSAEHSWQAALMVQLFSHWSNYPISVAKATKMLLVHDIVEIEAGDCNHIDDEACEGKAERELKAANSIYGENPEPPLREFRQLWDEFEEGKTAEAKFARAIDAFLPLFHAVASDGKSWNGWRGDKHIYIHKKKEIARGSTRLWEYCLELIDYCIARNWLY